MITVLMDDGAEIRANSAQLALMYWYIAQSPAQLPAVCNSQISLYRKVPSEPHQLFTLVIAACERNWNNTPVLNDKFSNEVQSRMLLNWIRQNGDIKMIIWG